MQSEHVLIYVTTESGDMAQRRLAWDLLARGWALKVTYLDGAELTVSASGKQDIGHNTRVLAILCETARVDQVFEHIGYGAHIVAVPAIRVAL